MTASQPMLELFEPAPEAVVPSCWTCGATGERIEVDGLAVPDLHAAALWAVLEIGRHNREVHGG